MQLTDAELNYFDLKVLKLKKEARDRYLDQVDYLISRLLKKAEEDGSLGICKFHKAGSLKKGTILRPRGEDGVDADVALYITAEDDQALDLATLHERIRALLVAIYPQKKPADFEVQPRTLGIVFHDSGLAVDVVPVIAIDGPGDYGWQPSSRGAAPVKTSIPGQLRFIKTRADHDIRYKRLVRLLKKWRNQQELGALRSFAIELILAHIQDVRGPAESLESGLLRFFLYVAETGLTLPISFPENGVVSSYPSSPIVILDPVNSENNVTSRITTEERIEIVEKAKDAWEALTIARRNNYLGETLELWKEVFGRSFVTEE